MKLHTTSKTGARITSVAAGSTLGLLVAEVRLFLNADVEHAKSVPFIGERSNKAPWSGCAGLWLFPLPLLFPLSRPLVTAQ